MAVYSLWQGASPPASIAQETSDTAAVSLGTIFTVSSNVTATAVRFYFGAAWNALGKPSAVAIYNNTSGAQLASASYSGTPSTGWTDVPISLALTTSVSYIVVAYYPDGRYGAQGSYFNNIDPSNGPLAIAFNTSAGNYDYGVGIQRPTSNFNFASYFIDVLVSDGAAATAAGQYGWGIYGGGIYGSTFGEASTPKSGTDTQTLSDVSQLSMYFTVTDTQTETDVSTTTAQVGTTDTFSFSEAAVVIETMLLLAANDSLTITEASAVATALDAADVLTLSDASVLTQSLGVTATDSFTFDEISSIAAALSATEAASVAEVAAIAAALAATDIETLSDASNLLSIDDKLVSDSFVLTDASALDLTNFVNTTDAATLGEASEFEAAIAAVDAAVVAENTAISAALAASDAATFAESANIADTLSIGVFDSISLTQLAEIATALSAADASVLSELSNADELELKTAFDSLVLAAETAVQHIVVVTPEIRMPTNAAIIAWAALATLQIYSAEASIMATTLDAAIEGNIKSVTINENIAMAAVTPNVKDANVG